MYFVILWVNPQIPSAALVIFLPASDVFTFVPSYGIAGSQHDRGQHLWIFCNVGCLGSWRIYHFQRLVLSFVVVYEL